MTEATATVLAVDLPAYALLARYQTEGAFTDCHAVDVPQRVAHAAFVEAFLTSTPFALERRLLGVFARRPSTDDDARRLASGLADDRPFAAWTVEARAERQLLLRDITGRTRTWLMSAPLTADATRLYLGSAVLPAGTDPDGRPRMGAVFHALRGLHAVYSRALLRAAWRRLMRDGRQTVPAPAAGRDVDDRPAAVPAATPATQATQATAATAAHRAASAAAGPQPRTHAAVATATGVTRPRRRARPTAIRDDPASSPLGPSAQAPSTSVPPGSGGAPPAAPLPAPRATGARRRGGPPYRARPTPEEVAAMPPFEALPLDRIVLIRTPAEADAALHALRAARVVGFDTESKPTFTSDAVRDGPHVIQLATRERGYVVQVNEAVPIDLLRAVLENEAIVKVGFGLDSDRGPLEHKLGLRLRGTVEVSDRLRRLGHKDALGAKAAVAVVLGRRLQKSKRVQTSNWGAPTLTTQQIVYAANDAYAALKVYQALDEDPVATRG